MELVNILNILIARISKSGAKVIAGLEAHGDRIIIYKYILKDEEILSIPDRTGSEIPDAQLQGKLSPPIGAQPRLIFRSSSILERSAGCPNSSFSAQFLRLSKK